METEQKTKPNQSKFVGIGCLVIVTVAIIIGVVVALSGNGGNEGFYAEITDVQDSMTAISVDVALAWEYKAGPLKGGVAVLVNNNGAYWVKDGVVYAANGFAKTWSPGVDYAPTGIDIGTVEDAVR